MASACSMRINASGLLVICSRFALSSTFLALPMQTHPPSSQPDTVSYSGLGCLSPPFTALRAPLVDVQPEGDGVLLHRVQYNHQPPLDIDHSHAAGLGTLVDLAHRLKPLLAPGYRWLGQEDLSVAGARPIDAGGFADVWVGEMDDRKVAVKSYRCYESADHMPTYNVSYPLPPCALCPLTTDR